MKAKKRPRAIVLAAGSGRRFLKSGGVGYKQLTHWKGESVISRIVRQVEESSIFDGITVVLGEDADCRAAIRAELTGHNVTYVRNPQSGQDNNLLSFKYGVAGLESPVLVIESDIVVTTEDIVCMASGLKDDEIRWAEIGDIANFDHGGLIEIDPATGFCFSVDILSRAECRIFKDSGRQAVKMFGLTGFGVNALAEYKTRIDFLADPYNKYFHHVAINEPHLFSFAAHRVSKGCFSFNTVSELPQINV